MDTRNDGKVTPAYDHAYMGGSGDALQYFNTALETLNPGGNPRQYAFANNIAYYHEDGSKTTDITFSTTDQTGGAVIGFDSASPPLKKLYVGFGNGTTIKNAVRVLTTDTTPWTTTAAAGAAQFGLIIKAGPDLYAVTNGGVVASLNDFFRISKCPAGNDPTLATSWGAGFTVGTPDWGITGLSAIGTAPVVGKPDGLYIWDDQTKRFENKLPHLIACPHGLNGKGMTAVTNGIMYPTYDGKLYFFDGISITEVTPQKGEVRIRDDGMPRITAIADNGDSVAVVREAFQQTLDGQRARNAGMKVITYINGTFTDVTTSVSNGVLTDGASMNTWGGSANDRLLIGLDAPWEGAVIRVVTVPNTAVQSFSTPAYSNGTAGTVAPFTSSFTSFTAGVDGTILVTAAVSLALVSYPPNAAPGVLTWTDPNAWTLMTKTALTMTGVNGGAPLSKYWVSWGPVTATGMSNAGGNPTMNEVEVIYGRAAPATSTSIADTSNFMHRDRANCLTHVLIGKRQKTVGFVWSDVYALNMYGGVWAIAWTNAKTGSTTNGGQSLLLWGRWKQALIAEGFAHDPSRTPWPMVVKYSASKPGPLLDLAPGGIVLQNSLSLIKNRRKRVAINNFIVLGEFGPGEQNAAPDKLELYLQSDQVDIAFYGEAQGMPAILKGTQMTFGSGQRIYAWLAYLVGETPRPQAPQIREILIDYDEVDEEYEFYVAPDTAALPEKT